MHDEPEPLDTIAGEVRRETCVTKSRFIATLAPVPDEAAAQQRIAEVRREFHDARHHCTALMVGPDGARQRSNDDGEPSGTAGAPMLAVLQGAEITDVVAIVTRYFGGTLLGAGGLVRAYGDAVRAALDDAPRVTRRRVHVVEVRASHAEAGRLEHRLRQWAARHGADMAPGAYDATGAAYELAVPAGALDELHAMLGEVDAAADLAERGTEIRDIRQ
ncbi:IMPACT family protein [Egibacter rhizosphaerae]|uniref:IMPACT family protein n=1 Tax=Egibacter rhizosphaerae TaxID=1670831 RepID=UPI00197A8AF9|nr:YigZ family protein [Egibacter rhizosphaerae]